jgi:hypothetical protein
MGPWRRRIATGLAVWLLILSGLAWVELSPPRQPQQQEQTGGGKGPEEGDYVAAAKRGEDALATYTLWLVIFTGILAASTIGLWLVTEKTLRHAKGEANRQSRDMRDSIAAAETANRIARENFVEARRAWLDIIEVKLVAPTSFKEDRLLIGMSIAIKNLGSTPAINAVVETEASFGGANFNEMVKSAREKVERRSATMPIGHNIFPNDVAEYGPRWGHGPDEFASHIHILTGVRQMMTSFVVAVGYKIVGDSTVHYTHRTYVINLPVGIEVKEGTQCVLETMPFLAGDIS